MRLVLRIAPMVFLFALLAGPGEPLNWAVGVALAAPLAAAIGHLRPIAPTSAARLVFAPWYALGVLVHVIDGAVQTARFLLLERAWSRIGVMRCPAIAETHPGDMLVGLAETISPGSVVISAERELTMSAIDANAPEDHCRKLRRWHGRYQRPMID